MDAKKNTQMYGVLGIIFGFIGILIGISTYFAGTGTTRYSFTDPFMQQVGIIGIISFICVIIGGILVMSKNKSGSILLILGGLVSFILLYRENINSFGFLLHMLSSFGAIVIGYITYKQIATIN